MIMWDRIRRNIESGIDRVRRVAHYVSDRTRIEVRVGRLLMDKGELEIRRDKAYRVLGERAFTLMESNVDLNSDPEAMDAAREISMQSERIDRLKMDIKKVSIGEEED